MPDKIECRCHPIITVLYTPLALLRMLTALSKENSFFFFVRNNSKHRVLVTANLSTVTEQKSCRISK